MLPITLIDATGLFAVDEVVGELAARGVRCVAAGRQTEWQLWIRGRKLDLNVLKATVFPTLRQAVQAFRREIGAR
jgi:hypothetical protein